MGIQAEGVPDSDGDGDSDADVAADGDGDWAGEGEEESDGRRRQGMSFEWGDSLQHTELPQLLRHYLQGSMCWSITMKMHHDALACWLKSASQAHRMPYTTSACN